MLWHVVIHKNQHREHNCKHVNCTSKVIFRYHPIIAPVDFHPLILASLGNMMHHRSLEYYSW